MGSVKEKPTIRRQVTSTASGRKVIVHFQQLTGVTTSGFPDNGTWTDVPGLSNVPITFRTMRPYERAMVQQLFPSIKSWAFMRWRPGVNVRSNMRLMYGNHIYRILDADNYDEANTDIILYLEEWQPTGTTRQ